MGRELQRSKSLQNDGTSSGQESLKNIITPMAKCTDSSLHEAGLISSVQTAAKTPIGFVWTAIRISIEIKLIF